MNDTTYEPLADEAIRLYALCHSLHSLPSVGGILDQDYVQIWLLECVRDAVTEKEQLDAKSSARGRR